MYQRKPFPGPSVPLGTATHPDSEVQAYALINPDHVTAISASRVSGQALPTFYIEVLMIGGHTVIVDQVSFSGAEPEDVPAMLRCAVQDVFYHLKEAQAGVKINW